MTTTTSKVTWDSKGVEEYVGRAVEVVEKDIAKKVYTEIKNSAKFSDKTGKLRKSIELFKSKYPKGGYIVYASAPHAHLIEYGTADRSTKDGAFRGAVKARPFIRPVAKKYKKKFVKELEDKLGDLVK